MPKKLLITEKPSVAMEFAKALQLKAVRKNGYLESEEWIITWCVGHLVTMSYPEAYDEKLKYWRLDTLPFLPKEYKYEVIPAVQKQFMVVKELLQREDIEEIYNAGDSGREGEYIQRLVFMMAKPNPKAKMKRVWIDSQTEEEILRGIREAKDLASYDSLAHSAYLRAKEDYLIGINFSRLLSIIYGKRLAKEIGEEKTVISIGRVMTCVLGMVVLREREIRSFQKTLYYKLIGKFKEGEHAFEAEWRVNEKSSLLDSPKLYNESGFKKLEDLKDMATLLKDKKAIVTEVKKQKQKENAPLLFNLAEIQNECTKLFKIKPDETLEIIQNLYEKKLVTYPRTDARVLSTAVAKEIRKNLNGIARGYQDEETKGLLDKMIAEKYSTDLLKTKYVNDSKITDHYAIIPTGQGYENYDAVPELHKRIYKIIVKRFLAIFYPPAEYTKVSITIEIEKENFYATARVCDKRGYLDVLKSSKEEQTEKENIAILASLTKGKEITPSDFESKEAETTPPNRYNTGSMILAMENAGKLIEEEELREQIKGAGIGTSATRAEIIKKLERIQYIAIHDKTQIITPTLKGEKIFDIVSQSMPDMLNPKLTASWEKGLEMVAKSEIQPDVFMCKLENYIHSKVDKLVIKI